MSMAYRLGMRMKGIIFTEFLKMVEEVFSPEIADRIINESDTATGGAYTTVGTYDHHELIRMVSRLSEITGISVPELEIAYGKYLFNIFTERYNNLIINAKSCFDFLISIDSYIHIEVRKLYPDAELPTFHHQLIGPHHLLLEYHSRRPFADLAEGLILGCADYFGEKIELKRENIPTNKSTKGNIVIFAITKKE
jgi:hypothetical protein